MGDDSRHESLVVFVILFIITLGLYIFYWFYMNWVFFKKIDKSYDDVSPGLKTAGLIVPIFNLVLLHEQFYAILDLAERKNIRAGYSPGAMVFALVFLSFFIYIFWPLYILLLLVFVKFQVLLNKISMQDASSKTKVSAKTKK